MKQSLKPRHSWQKGITLIELLVGMAVALIAILVITQMYAEFEGQKRTSVAGADVQENGLSALLTLERDIRMAGYGLTANPLLSCTTIYSGYDDPNLGVIQPAPGLSATALMPVRIIEGGAGPDSIVLVTSSSIRPGVPTQIRQAMPTAAADLKVTNATGFQAGDVIIVSDGANCSVMQITQIQSPASGAGLFGFVHNNGQGAPFNMASNITNGWPAYGVGAQIYQLGQLASRSYTIGASANTQALFVTDMIPPGNANPMVADIVDLQAQYGLAAPGSQQVTCWVNATNGGNICDGGDWQNPTAAQVQRIRAVRLAVLARSPIPEKPSLPGGLCGTTTAPLAWSGGNFNMPANWQCHRFKVFETVVPLRNVIWGNA